MPAIEDDVVEMDRERAFIPLGIPSDFQATTVIPDDPGPTTSWSDTWSASLGRYNPYVAMQRAMPDEEAFGDPIEDYDPFPSVLGTHYEPFAMEFIRSRSPKHTDAIKMQIDRDIKEMQDIDRSGIVSGTVLPMVAGILDPTIALPGGSIFQAARTAKALQSAIRSAVSVAGWNMAATGIQEAILHEATIVRPYLESLIDIGASGILGGMIGGGISVARSAPDVRISGRVDRALGSEAMGEAIGSRLGAPAAGNAAPLPTLGAAVTNAGPTVEIADAATRRVAGAQARANIFGISLSGPVMQEATATSRVSREIGVMQGDIALAMTRNAEGIPTVRGGSVEAQNKMARAYLHEYLTRQRDHYFMYRYGTAKPGMLARAGGLISDIPSDLSGVRGSKLTMRQFEEEVAKAGRRGDTHEIPEVAAAARDLRTQIIEPIGTMGVQAKVLEQEIMDRTRALKADPNDPEAAARMVEEPSDDTPIDPEVMQNVEAILDRAQAMLGRNFEVPPAMRKQVMEGLARDTDLWRRLANLIDNEGGPQFGIDPETGRLVRTDGGDTGEAWGDVLGRIEAGETVDISPAVVRTLKNEMMQVWEEMPRAIRNQSAMVMTRAEPSPNGRRVLVTFEDVWGITTHTLKLTPEAFRTFRAAHHGGHLLFRASAIGNVAGGVPNRAFLKGQIWHEYVHARLSRAEGLDDAGKAAWARVLDHNNDVLRVLDQQMRDYSRKIGDPVWEQNTPRTLQEIYDDVYRAYDNKDAYIAEEIVAHIMELRSHGQLTPEELAPIEDALEELFGELPPAAAREGQEPQLAIAGEPNMVDGINQMIPPRNRELTRVRDNHTATWAARDRLERAAKSERTARSQAINDLGAGLTLKVGEEALQKISRVLGELGGVRGFQIGAVSRVTPIGNDLARIDIIGNVGSGRNVSETATVRIDTLLDSQTLLSRDGRRGIVFTLAGLEEGDDGLRGAIANVVLEGKVIRGDLPAGLNDRLVSHIEALDPLSRTIGAHMRDRGLVPSHRIRNMTLRDYYTLAHRGEPNFEDILKAKAAGILAEDYSSGRMYVKDAARFIEDFAGLIPARSTRDEVQLAISDLARRNDAIALDDIVPDEVVPHPAKKILAFHGTRADFDRFDPKMSADFGMHFGTSDQANFIVYGAIDAKRLIPVVLDVKNPLTLDDLIGWDVERLWREARAQGVRFTDEDNARFREWGSVLNNFDTSVEAARKALDMEAELVKRFQTALTNNGYDSVRYINTEEGYGWSYVVWDEGKVTSATSGKVMLAVSDYADNRGPVDPGLRQNGDHEDRIANRFPTQKQSWEDPFTENLIINQEAMRASPAAYKHNANMIRQYPNWPKSNKVRNPDKVKAAFKDHIKENLRFLYNLVPEARREETRQWYDGARRITETWASDYNVPPRAVAGILAALSPGKDWFANVSMGERMLDVWTYARDASFDDAMAKTANRVVDKKGKLLLPIERQQAIQGRTLAELIEEGDSFNIASFIRVYDQTYNPGKLRQVTATGEFIGEPTQNINWQSYDNIAKAVRILMDPSKENISREMGEAHKIRNFYNNILAPNAPFGDVTIDTHAIAAALLRPLAQSSMEVGHGLGSGTAKGVPNTKDVGATGTKGLYGIYADAYRELAEELNILPRELQSITWEAVRELFPRAWKRPNNIKAVDDIWMEFRDGKITAEDARSQILAYRGGDEGFAIAEPSRRVDDQTWPSSYERNVSGAVDAGGGPQRVPGRGGRGVDPDVSAVSQLGRRGVQDRRGGRRRGQVRLAIGNDLFGNPMDVGFDPRLDAAGFTSSVLEAARRMKGRVGPPGQLIGELERMGGVSKRELNHLNLRQRFHGQKRITRDELIEAIEMDRVRLMATEFDNEEGRIADIVTRDEKLLGRLADEIVSDQQYWSSPTRKSVLDSNDPYAQTPYRASLTAVTREQAMAYLANRSEDDIAEFVKEAIARDPEIAREYPELVQPAKEPPAWNAYSPDPNNKSYAETVISIPNDKMLFPGAVGGGAISKGYSTHRFGNNDPKNLLLHLRKVFLKSGGIYDDVRNKRHYVLAELQSDAAQGMRRLLGDIVANWQHRRSLKALDEKTQKEVASLIKERGYSPASGSQLVKDLSAEMSELSGEEMQLARAFASAEQEMMAANGDHLALREERRGGNITPERDAEITDELNAISDRWEVANAEFEKARDRLEGVRSDIDRLQELRSLARNIPDNMPYFESTDAWATPGIRRAIMEAVDDDADFFTIATGDTVDSYGMGTPRTGAIGFYDTVLPKIAREIFRKIDKSIKMEFVSDLVGDARNVGRGSGKKYTLHEYNGQHQLLEHKRVMRDWDGNEIDPDDVLQYDPDDIEFAEWGTPVVLKRFDNLEEAQKELARIAGTEGGFWSFRLTDKAKRIIRNDRLPALAVAGGTDVNVARELAAARRAREARDLINDVVAKVNEEEPIDEAVAKEVWGKGNASYMHRVWLAPKIKQEPDRFMDILIDYFEESQGRARVILEKMEKATENQKIDAKTQRTLEGLRRFVDQDRTELYDIALGIKSQILDNKFQGHGRMMGLLPPGLRGPLKARTLNIPDTFVGKTGGAIEDFMENNASRIARYYVESMIPQINQMRKFGSIDMEEQLQKIRDDYDRLIAAVKPEDPNNPKHVRAAARKKAKLQDEKNRSIRNQEAMRDRNLGLYGLPDDPTAMGPRWARGFKILEVLTHMGGVVVSSIPDVARVTMTQGVGDTFAHGIRPLISTLEATREARRVNAEDLRLAGTALEYSMPRIQQIGDVHEEGARLSGIERGLEYALDKFGQISFANMWNENLKLFVGRVATAKIIQAAERVAKGIDTPADRLRLGRSNIALDQAEIIAQQFEKHGGISEGVYFAKTKSWDVNHPEIGPRVQDALYAFRAALTKEVDSTIVTPGLNRPNWLDTWYGSVLGQFKSFLFAAQEVVFLKGLQERDAAVLFGLISMIGFGMVVEFLKNWGSDRPTPETLPQWIAAGIDRSGVTGWLFEVNHMSERVLGLGLSNLTGKELSRYAGRNWIDAFLGPTAGSAKDLQQALFGAPLEGMTRESQLKALRRLIPLQNLFYLQWMLDRGQDNLVDSLGLEKIRRRGPGFEIENVPDSFTTFQSSDAGSGTRVASADVPRETSAAPVQVAEAPQPTENESPRRVTRSPGTIPTVA